MSVLSGNQMDEKVICSKYSDIRSDKIPETPEEAIDYINKVLLEKYQNEPTDSRTLQAIKAHVKSMLNDFERSGIVCTHDIEVVLDLNDPRRILIRKPVKTVTLQDQIDKYDSLTTRIRNILTDAGIPDHEEYPEEDVDDYEKSLRTGGRMIPLDKRVQILVDRFRSVGGIDE